MSRSSKPKPLTFFQLGASTRAAYAGSRGYAGHTDNCGYGLVTAAATLFVRPH
jgi:hypothetical protein